MLWSFRHSCVFKCKSSVVMMGGGRGGNPQKNEKTLPNKNRLEAFLAQ